MTYFYFHYSSKITSQTAIKMHIYNKSLFKALQKYLKFKLSCRYNKPKKQYSKSQNFRISNSTMNRSIQYISCLIAIAIRVITRGRYGCAGAHSRSRPARTWGTCSARPRPTRSPAARAAWSTTTTHASPKCGWTTGNISTTILTQVFKD